MFPTQRGSGPLVVAYGGGVNTVALLIRLRDLGERPTAIVMADPGSERAATVAYRDTEMAEWLSRHEWPSVTVVSLKSEAPFRQKSTQVAQRSLLEECMAIKALPSIAYGFKKCSLKHKARPANWWTERQPWAIDAWSRGEKITRAIGYDADEPQRARPEILDGLEAKRFSPYYPLLNAGFDRDACIALIQREGLRVPVKSACKWCPSNTIAEWRDLHDNDPEGWEEAVAMSRNAEIDVPDVVGLMRCNPRGKRQVHLHVWNDAPAKADDDARDAMPCECAL